MNIKRATLKDVPELTPLINTSFNNFNGQGPGWTHNANLVKGPRITPENPHELITDGVSATILKYVDENDNKILGCVKLELKLVSSKDANSKNENDVEMYELNQCQCQRGSDCIDTDNNNQSGSGFGTSTGYESEIHCTSPIIETETSTTTQKVCYLKLLSVLPHMQGQNIGSHILDASEEWAKLNGCSIIEIDVVCRMVPLIEFYERRGYVRTGVVKPYKVRSDCSLLIERMHMVFLEKVLQ